MSFTQQFEDDLAMGCVCDFDVACRTHPRPVTPHDLCEYVGWCATDCPWHNGRRADASDAFRAAHPPRTHGAYRKEWIADWAANTGTSKRNAALAFETMLNQSWAGCTCAACGNESAA